MDAAAHMLVHRSVEFALLLLLRARVRSTDLLCAYCLTRFFRPAGSKRIVEQPTESSLIFASNPSGYETGATYLIPVRLSQHYRNGLHEPIL